MKPKRIRPHKVKNVQKKAGTAVVAKVRRDSVQAYGERWDWMAVRQRVIERDGGRCRKCSSTTQLQVDHIRPVAKGGVTTMSNLWTLCAPCHSKRPGHKNARHLILAKSK
jgi:5-methylcytosine-specific restriction endonuclease McrA